MASIFKITNKEPKTRYDFYNKSAIIIADTMEEALATHPNNRSKFVNGSFGEDYLDIEWNTPENLEIQCIGKANKNIEKGVLVSEFFNG